MILKGKQWGMLGGVKMSTRLCRDWHEGSDTQNDSSAKGYVRKEWRAVTFVCIATRSGDTPRRRERFAYKGLHLAALSPLRFLHNTLTTA